MPTPAEVRMVTPIITQIYAGFIGMKKKRIEVTKQMKAEKINVLRFEPSHFVQTGDRPPKIMQVTSPKAINTV